MFVTPWIADGEAHEPERQRAYAIAETLGDRSRSVTSPGSEMEDGAKAGGSFRNMPMTICADTGTQMAHPEGETWQLPSSRARSSPQDTTWLCPVAGSACKVSTT